MSLSVTNTYFVAIGAFLLYCDTVCVFLQAFRESAVPGASELLQQLANAKTDEDKEAIKAAVVSINGIESQFNFAVVLYRLQESQCFCIDY